MVTVLSAMWYFHMACYRHNTECAWWNSLKDTLDWLPCQCVIQAKWLYTLRSLHPIKTQPNVLQTFPLCFNPQPPVLPCLVRRKNVLESFMKSAWPKKKKKKRTLKPCVMSLTWFLSPCCCSLFCPLWLFCLAVYSLIFFPWTFHPVTDILVHCFSYCFPTLVVRWTILLSKALDRWTGLYY